MVKNKNVDPFTMCMYSPSRFIKTEWRCIFVNGEYVSGSQYMTRGELDVSSTVPQNVINRAIDISKESYFTNVFDFVIDIGEVEDEFDGEELKLIEVNAIETCSFYAADLHKVYKTLSSVCTAS